VCDKAKTINNDAMIVGWSCSRIFSGFSGSDALFNLFGFIRRIVGQVIGINNRAVFNFSRFLHDLVAFLPGILLNGISLGLRLLGYSFRFFIRFRLDAGGLAAEIVRLVRRLFFIASMCLSASSLIASALSDAASLICCALSFALSRFASTFDESSQPARIKQTAEAISVLLRVS
jgi:hypothetical protein